ncbi:MAG: acyl-CoA dehydrogenase family protein [Polyangiales bacterium]
MSQASVSSAGAVEKSGKSEIPTREELIERARALVPVLKERAKEAGELRRVPDATIADFHRLGFFKVVQPKRYGGYEMDPATIFDLQLELGRGCASSAWCYGVISVHSWQLALFDEKAQDEVWKNDPTTLISSSYMPVGKTKWVDGGVTLSGRWSFSSGCDHCEWVMLGGFVPSEEGALRYAYIFGSARRLRDHRQLVCVRVEGVG